MQSQTIYKHRSKGKISMIVNNTRKADIGKGCCYKQLTSREEKQAKEDKENEMDG